MPIEPISAILTKTLRDKTIELVAQTSMSRSGTVAVQTLAKEHVSEQLINRQALRQVARRTGQNIHSSIQGQEKDVDDVMKGFAQRGLSFLPAGKDPDVQNILQKVTILRAAFQVARSEDPLALTMNLRGLFLAHSAAQAYPRGERTFREIRYTGNDERLWNAAQANGGRIDNKLLDQLRREIPQAKQENWLISQQYRLATLERAGLVRREQDGGYQVTSLYFEKHMRFQLQAIPRPQGELVLYNTDRKLLTKAAAVGGLVILDERQALQINHPGIADTKETRIFDRSLAKLEQAGLVERRGERCFITEAGTKQLEGLKQAQKIREEKPFKYTIWDRNQIMRPLAGGSISLAEWEARVHQQYASSAEANRQWCMISRRLEKHAAAGNVTIEAGRVNLTDRGRDLAGFVPSKPFAFGKFDAEQIQSHLVEPKTRQELAEIFRMKYSGATLDRQWGIFDRRLQKNIDAGMIGVDQAGRLYITDRGHDAREKFEAQAKELKTVSGLTPTDVRLLRYAENGVFTPDGFRTARQKANKELQNDFIDQEVQVAVRRLERLQKMGLAAQTAPQTFILSPQLQERLRVMTERSRDPKALILATEQDVLLRQLGTFANMTRSQVIARVYHGDANLFALDFEDLKRRRLVETTILQVRNFGTQEILGLTRTGRKAAGYRIGDDQILTESKMDSRPVELAHDLLIVDAYYDMQGRLEAAGKKVLRISSDRQTKSRDMREAGVQSAAYADLEIQYVDAETGEVGIINVEVAINYTDKEIGKKATIPNCVWYTPRAAQAARIQTVIPGAQVVRFGN